MTRTYKTTHPQIVKGGVGYIYEITKRPAPLPSVVARTRYEGREPTVTRNRMDNEVYEKLTLTDTGSVSPGIFGDAPRQAFTCRHSFAAETKLSVPDSPDIIESRHILLFT
ncbi:hypothetical protein EVAR_45609_1 [Eumeta japonica]|uniref:Uncharacterized protein n=1 Tax=Eumeta variegata TaxID=151549 RepID=A0A4C1WHE5_EUMVA|nr:hypothetical protein EVAR_45609_1 [Eumeta japonica]